MVRIIASVASKKRKKRVLRQTKGQFAQRHKRYQQAIRSLAKGLVYQFRDRKVRKREFRSLWIARLNAACRAQGVTYSRFIKGLSNAKVLVNRKMLSELAIHSPDAFKKLVLLSQENNKVSAKK